MLETNTHSRSLDDETIGILGFAVIITIVATVVCLLFGELFGCSKSETAGETQQIRWASSDDRFAYNVGSDTLHFGEIIDTQTGIHYLVIYDYKTYGISGITPLLDKDGKPVISEEYVTAEPDEHASQQDDS